MSKSRTELEMAIKELTKRNMEKSLSLFAQHCWHIVEPATPYKHGWHIDAICEHLEAVTEGRIRNLVINMPPRHMKSMLVCVFWPCWVWATKPESRWLYSSYAQSLSIRDSLKCRRIIESRWYRENWPHVKMNLDQNQKARFENSHTGYRVSTSVGGSATGEGGDFIVCDDPHKVGDVPSERIREQVVNWWNEEMSTRGNDPKKVAKVIVAQRVHENDLCGYVLQQGGYELLCLAAEFDGHRSETSLGWKDPRDREGDLLWNERFGQEELDELKKRLGAYAAAAQLQQRPAPAGGGLFKEEWWRFWDEFPASMDEIIQSWDMAFKSSAKGSFVVCQVWGRIGSQFYLLDQVRKRMSFPQTVTSFKEMYAKWPSTMAILVEDKANGPAIIDTLKGQIPGIIPVTPDGSKIARASAISALIEAGDVLIPNPKHHPWVVDFLRECGSFPVGPNDDQVDAMSQGLERLRRQIQAGLFGIRRGHLKRNKNESISRIHNASKGNT